MSTQRKTALITGASDGVGKEVASQLAMLNYDVILHGRDRQKTEAVQMQMLESGLRNTDIVIADLSSLAEVRRMAVDVSRRSMKLDLLINNAGIGIENNVRQESKDGIELRFAVNYLSHFLLTHLLRQQLEAAGSARVVNVSSAGQAPIDFADLMLERGYSGFQAYCQSKLAQIMFTIDLAQELGEAGTTVNAIHPATFMNTKMVETPISSVQDGAAAILNLACSSELRAVTGAYFNQHQEAHAHPQAYSDHARRQLRAMSETLSGIDLSRSA